MPIRHLLHTRERQAQALDAGGWLFCAWLALLGLGVSAQMLYVGSADTLVLALHLLAPIVASAGRWAGRHGLWRPAAAGLILFVFGMMFVLDHGRSEYVVASLMNIAVLTLFAAWMLGTAATAVVVLVSQIQLILLVLQGSYRWSAMLPMMLTCLALGGVAILVRRAYERYVLRLAVASNEILKHQDTSRQLTNVVEQSPYSIEIFDLQGRITYVNTTFERHTGYTKKQVLGRHVRDLSFQALDEAQYRLMTQTVQAGQVWHGVVHNFNKAGQVLSEQVTVTPLYDDAGQLSQSVVSKLDISDKVHAQECIEQLMYFDKLTLLPNRLALTRKLQALLAPFVSYAEPASLNAMPHSWHGVLLIGIDRFNQFNLARGSQWADAVLQAFAAKLEHMHLDHPQMWLARYGADQFVWVLEDIGRCRVQAREKAVALAQMLQQQITHVVVDADAATPIAIGFSTGVTVFPFVEPDLKPDSSDRIMRRATIALAHSKGAGLQHIHSYAEALAQQVEWRVQLEADLRTAIHAGALHMVVQPQYDKDSQVVGMEALVRWQHPDRGWIAPSEFMPIAERAGLAAPIGAWMLEQACALLNTSVMQQRGFSVSVNISAQHFSQADFVAGIAQLLARTQAPAHRLVLEVTESMCLVQMDEALRTMQQLKAMGLEIALDDFGTGYSSLSYLKSLPIDEVKIDQSFIRGIDPSGSSGILVQAVLMIAQQLGLRVVAEGVEHEADAQLLQAWEPAILCQGHGLSQPMPVAQWLQHLAAIPAQLPVGKISN